MKHDPKKWPLAYYWEEGDNGKYHWCHPDGPCYLAFRLLKPNGEYEVRSDTTTMAAWDDTISCCVICGKWITYHDTEEQT